MDISLLIFRPTTEWIEPKTDWIATDFYNAVDYNRQVNNLEVIKEYTNYLFPNISIGEIANPDKTYESMIYASEINDIENRINEMNTYAFSFGLTAPFVDNGSTPTYADFNRIESAELKLYETMKSQCESMYVLDFTLGGQKGVRV